MNVEEQVQDAEVKEPVADSGEQEQRSDPKIEAEAREMGWVPESEWKGEPPKGGFKSAEDFVQRGKEVLPIVNSRLREENAKLADELDRLKRETTDKIARMERMSATALKQQRKQIEEQFEAQKEAAVEVGDKAAYKAADKAGREALAEFDKSAADEADDKGDKGKFEVPKSVKDTVDAWIAENPWMNSDKEMNAVANAHHERLLKEKPGLKLAENLAEVRKYVQKRFPEKFGSDDTADDEADASASRVEGGSRMNGGGGKSAWSRIPKDAQAQADRFIKDDGLFLEKGETAEKDIAKARERYAKQYLGE